MYPISHNEKRNDAFRMVGRIIIDLAAFAVVLATLWWIMTKV